MKRKYLLFTMVLFSAALAMTACGDDSDGNGGSPEEELTEANHWGLSDAEWAEWLRQEADRADSMNIDYVLRQLCDVSEDALGNAKYTPKYGEQLDMARPGVYTLADSTAEAAEKRFWWLLPGSVADSLQTRFPGRTEYVTAHGSIRYERGDGSNLLGTITVDIPEIPEVEKIMIIPAAFWPNNDSSTPFTLGSVWQEKSTGYKYVCVRERGGGQKGILVTYDGGWSGLDWWKGTRGWVPFHYINVYESWIYDNLSNETAAKALDDFARYQPTKAQAAFKAMGQENRFKKVLISIFPRIKFEYRDERWYATSRSGKTFHWGPSDYHYTLKIYKAYIGTGRFFTTEWKTCDGFTCDMRNYQNYLMYSKEFDYMDSGRRDVDWKRLAR